MISEELLKRIENIETTIAGLSRRLAIVEGDPEETPEEAKVRERAEYEERMKAIPPTFWKEPVSE